MTASFLPFHPPIAERLSADERRVWVRFPCKQKTFFSPSARESYVLWRAELSDLSAGGVGLVLSHRFDQGTELVIELPTRVDEPLHLVPVQVVRVSKAPEGRWVIGCEFVTQGSGEQLQALLRALDGLTDSHQAR